MLGRVEQLGSARKRKKIKKREGNAGERRRSIKAKCRVTFFILGVLDGFNGGFGDPAFSTLEKKVGEREKEEGEWEQGMAWSMEKEEHLQFVLLRCPVGKV